MNSSLRTPQRNTSSVWHPPKGAVYFIVVSRCKVYGLLPLTSLRFWFGKEVKCFNQKKLIKYIFTKKIYYDLTTSNVIIETC